MAFARSLSVSFLSVRAESAGETPKSIQRACVSGKMHLLVNGVMTRCLIETSFAAWSLLYLQSEVVDIGDDACVNLKAALFVEVGSASWEACCEL